MRNFWRKVRKWKNTAQKHADEKPKTAWDYLKRLFSRRKYSDLEEDSAKAWNYGTPGFGIFDDEQLQPRKPQRRYYHDDRVGDDITSNDIAHDGQPNTVDCRIAYESYNDYLKVVEQRRRSVPNYNDKNENEIVSIHRHNDDSDNDFMDFEDRSAVTRVSKRMKKAAKSSIKFVERGLYISPETEAKLTSRNCPNPMDPTAIARTLTQH